VILRLLRGGRIALRIVGIGITAFGFVVLIAAAYEILLPPIFRAAEPALVRGRRPLPEKANWPVECGGPGYETEQFVDTPPNGILGRSGQLWVRNRNSKRVGFMRAPGCRIEETDVAEDSLLISRFYVTVEGRSIFVRSSGRGDPEQSEVPVASRNYEQAVGVSSLDGNATWGPLEFGEPGWELDRDWDRWGFRGQLHRVRSLRFEVGHG